MHTLSFTQKRKCLVGLTTPIDFNPRALRKGVPTPVLEAPIGLFLLFDEIWFLHPNLCPWNMRKLPYVHFLSEEMHLAEVNDLLIQSQKVASYDKGEWENKARKLYRKRPLKTPAIPSPKLTLGEIQLIPSPLIFDNFAMDNAIACYYDLNLITNYVTNSITSSFSQTNHERDLTNLLLLSRIPNIYGKWGPYNPRSTSLIDDLRTSALLLEFREKISKACEELSTSPIAKIGQQIETELETIVYKSFSESFRRKYLYYSFANMVLGQIPIVSNILSVVLGINDFVQFYRTRKNSGWAGFIAYATERGAKRENDRTSIR